MNVKSREPLRVKVIQGKLNWILLLLGYWARENFMLQQILFIVLTLRTKVSLENVTWWLCNSLSFQTSYLEPYERLRFSISQRYSNFTLSQLMENAPWEIPDLRLMMGFHLEMIRFFHVKFICNEIISSIDQTQWVGFRHLPNDVK